MDVCRVCICVWRDSGGGGGCTLQRYVKLWRKIDLCDLNVLGRLDLDLEKQPGWIIKGLK